MQDDTLMSQEAFELDAILKENKNLVGSRHYFPPEMVGPKEKRLSSFQLDVWCLGILAFKLFCNRFPFETK
jgi:serine/threonine protein kinase